MPTSLLFIAAVLIWGSTFLVITFQLGEVAPAVSVVFRFGLGAVMLFAWSLMRRERIWPGWRAQPWLFLQGLLNFGVSYVCTYAAEGTVVSALVAVLFALMVFWNALGARLCFGTRLSWQTLCAAALSICGVGLLFSNALAESLTAIIATGGVAATGGAGATGATVASGTTGAAGGVGQAASSAGMVPGLLLAVAATLSASAGNLVAVRVGRGGHGSVFVTTAWAMAWAMVSVVLWALATGVSWVLPHTLQYWGAMLYLSLFGSVIAFTAYFTLINRIGPGKAAYTGVLTPVVSVLLSMRFEGYRPGVSALVGMMLCLVGVVWAIRSKAPPTLSQADRRVPPS